MPPLRFAFLALLACANCAVAAVSVLDQYLAGLKTLRASFTQTLVDAHDRQIERSQGTLVIARPGKFRWEVESGDAGGGQLLVADGKNVWFFDRDLEQVTVKPQSGALSATPAMLLSGTVDVRENFSVAEAGKRDALEWVLLTPKRADAEFRRALLGFGGGELKRMIVDDRLGQTATVSFENMKKNGPVATDELKFTPSPGVDVIGKAAP